MRAHINKSESSFLSRSSKLSFESDIEKESPKNKLTTMQGCFAVPNYCKAQNRIQKIRDKIRRCKNKLIPENDFTNCETIKREIECCVEDKHNLISKQFIPQNNCIKENIVPDLKETNIPRKLPVFRSKKMSTKLVNDEKNSNNVELSIINDGIINSIKATKMIKKPLLKNKFN